MPRVLCATASTSNVPITCYYYWAPYEVPDPQVVAGWLGQCAQGLQSYLPLRSISRVEVWAPSHPDAPPEFKRTCPIAGFYQPWDRVIKLHAHFAGWRLLAHEVGHHLASVRAEKLAEAFADCIGPQDREPPSGTRPFLRWLCQD